MEHMLEHVLGHAIVDSLKLLPFLFLTYFLMEYIENKTSDQTKQMLRKSGKWGPVFGGVLGAFPQCGFSAAASSLYAGKVITMGTLIAVYLSTSDEMLPIFISEAVHVSVIVKILLVKIIIGIMAGFLVDYTINRRAFWLSMKRKGDMRKNNPFQIRDICEQERCGCSEGIWKSTITHTLQVFGFILVVTILLNFGIEVIGEDGLKQFILNKPILGQLLAAMIGLIPNCASSVVLTQLYLEGAMHLGGLMSGLLTGAGVGVLVLFRANKNIKENIKVVATLYALGVVFGIIVQGVRLENWIY